MPTVRTGMWWIAALLALLVAAPAHATTVRATVEDYEGDKYQDALRFVAWEITDARGVDDALTVRRVRGGIEVTGARRLVAGRGCRATAPRRVRCRAPHRRDFGTLESLDVRLGPGDDRIALLGSVGWHMQIRGQDGDDHLDATAAGAAVKLSGGKGADRLAGGPLDDELQGDSGADAIDGGGGADMAVWPRAAAVRASLVTREAVSAGETDALTGIESLRAGAGDDVLEGDGGPNVLRGGAGADRLAGGEGDDELTGGYHEYSTDRQSSPDHLDGGGGNDRLSGRGGGDTYLGGPGDDAITAGHSLTVADVAPETVDCGDGTDHVLVPDRNDLVEPTCEEVDFRSSSMSGAPTFTVPPATVHAGWDVRGVLRCQVYVKERCDDATVVLADAADPERVLGSLEADVAIGEERPFTLELSPEGREEVRRRGSLLARLTVTTPYLVGDDARFSAVLRLRAS